jgi:hypothetical protein
MKRSLTQRGTALLLATVLNLAAAWLLVQQPAAGRGADPAMAGATRAKALASAALPPSALRGPLAAAPAARAPANPPPYELRDGACVPNCLPRRA